MRLMQCQARLCEVVAKQGSAQAASMSPADAPCSVRAELGALLRLAVPVSAAFLLNKSISFVGVLFVRYACPASRLPLHCPCQGPLCTLS